jgi:hypothetical protein
MGKKPLVGVVGTLCLGLGLAGCESSGSKPAYQGQTGNARNWVSSTSQPSPQGALQPAPASSSQGTQQAWSNTPKASTPAATPSYGSGTASPMPVGPSNAGTFVPTGGVDSGKGYPPPVSTTTPGPVSSNSWPMSKPPSDSGIVPVSGTAPATDSTQPGALPLTSKPTSSLSTSTRTTDGYGGSSLSPSPAAFGGSKVMLPPPPPMVNASSQAPADLPPASPAASKAFMDPPPAVSAMPANDTLPTLPPPPPAVQVPTPPAK